jgi:hypothetical protein
VTVESIDLTDCGIAAICVRGTHRQPITILDLPPASAPSTGFGVDHRLRALSGPAMSEYQYYDFLAVDRSLTAAEQAEVRTNMSHPPRLGGLLPSSPLGNRYDGIDAGFSSMTFSQQLSRDHFVLE